MCAINVYVNNSVHHHYGRPPKRNPALQAFAAAQMLREGWLGIDTAVKAAAATGVTRAAVKAAQIILESDENLAAVVLQGWEPLSRAADKVRGRVKLIEAFNNANSDDRAELGRVVGASELFDIVVAPAL